jgi:hypothetical protein
MMQVAQVLKDNAPYLSEWITREQGKPLGGVGPDQVPGARFELWGCEVWDTGFRQPGSAHGNRL